MQRIRTVARPEFACNVLQKLRLLSFRGWKRCHSATGPEDLRCRGRSLGTRFGEISPDSERGASHEHTSETAQRGRVKQWICLKEPSEGKQARTRRTLPVRSSLANQTSLCGKSVPGCRSILPEEHHDAWLSGEAGKEILVPYPAERMKAWPVSPRVNSPKNMTLRSSRRSSFKDAFSRGELRQRRVGGKM